MSAQNWIVSYTTYKDIDLFRKKQEISVGNRSPPPVSQMVFHN